MRTGRDGCGRDPGAGRGGKDPPLQPWGRVAPRPEVSALRLQNVQRCVSIVTRLVLHYCGPSRLMQMHCQVPEGSTVGGFPSVRPALSHNAPIRDRRTRRRPRPRPSWGSGRVRWVNLEAGPLGSPGGGQLAVSTRRGPACVSDTQTGWETETWKVARSSHQPSLWRAQDRPREPGRDGPRGRSRDSPWWSGLGPRGGSEGSQ